MLWQLLSVISLTANNMALHAMSVQLEAFVVQDNPNMKFHSALLTRWVDAKCKQDASWC